MPQISDPNPTPAVTSFQGVGDLRIQLPIAVVIVAACGMLATAGFELNVVAADTAIVVPAQSSLPTPVTEEPNVPDASTVFRGRNGMVNEPLPTF